MAARDRYRRRLHRQLSPDERLRRMAELTEAAFAILRQNPQGWDRFYRRNLRKRAIPMASISADAKPPLDERRQ